MKFDVVIVGPYNSENIGDFVMLFGFLILFHRMETSINKIYILTSKNKNELHNILREELLFLDKKYENIISKIDIVGYRYLIKLLLNKKVWIFGGGFVFLPNILSNPKRNLILLFKYTFLPFLAKIFGNKVIFYSVDGLPSFLSKFSGLLGKVYTRSWILHKYYGYRLILDVGHLYFEELDKIMNNIRVDYKKIKDFDEDNPDINKYKPREFYKLIFLKKNIVTRRYHTLLFSLMYELNYTINTNNIFNKLRLYSLVKAYSIYKNLS